MYTIVNFIYRYLQVLNVHKRAWIYRSTLGIFDLMYTNQTVAPNMS